MNKNLETIDGESINEGGLVINQQMKQDLLVSAKWGKFLAIVGFIMLGFMLLGAIGMFGMGSSMGRQVFPVTSMGILYLLIIGLYFFPTYYLLQYSNKIKEAVTSVNNMSMQEAFSFMAKLYRFIGVLTVVILSLYFIFFIFFIGVLGTRGF
jgi:hypothetical protein